MHGDTVIQTLELHGYRLTETEKADVRLACEVDAKAYAIGVVERMAERVAQQHEVV